ncbi:tetratricopeptide repeat protein [Dinoroseobacter sp. PD6]|uniref:tetratricopeptide repeat protein n=1 Tax=Dinoroseobacter sp. PD6 TaxID=3028384 RepID=UPI00237BAE4D|nr:tetratricopeptide repeat protein [Dinoroseobacter sp. PD6]MDD9718211.1 tetratricopeptide repeat protein [Dinoroseobacter sp. PD6]
MTGIVQRLNAAFAAGFLCVALAGGAVQAQSADVETLMERLQAPDLQNWEAVERRIYDAWSQSGSPAADLLLDRGRDAMEAQNYDAAIEHLTALTDHAPEFAEGWYARATAYFLADLYGPALSDLGRALTLNPQHFGALSGVGRILSEMGEPEAALAAFQAAKAIHPKRPDISEAIESLERELGGQSL